MRTFVALSGLLVLSVGVACNAAPPAPAPANPSVSSKVAARAVTETPVAPKAAAQAPSVTHLGEPITGSALVSLTEVAKAPDSFKGKTITTTGTVSAVCQAMGCWMELKDDAGVAHIKMAGHSFFVPKTAVGHRAKVQAVVVSGGAKAAADGAKQGKHGKHGGDEEDCNEEAKQQMGHPVAKLELEATGIDILE